ncbi:MAG TPA: sulfotransferase [Pyrinomonadaceae bacterium]|jgi:sulfotransferase family protein|nr:sulfotransferase [Pyrinomonadaceae bacterium]
MSLLNALKRGLHIESKPADDRADKYLFIICMNNSGSTLLERVMSECRNAVGFPPPGGPNQQVNGQGFVPKYMPIPGKMTPQCRRIWSEQAAILQDQSRYNWPKIKQRWNEEWAKNPKFHTANPRVFLEKSPPNIFRAAMLHKHFTNSFFILMQRNPYAVAEGIRRRAKLSIERCVRHWIHCAQQQMRNEQILRRAIKISYEELSEKPESCRQQVLSFIPELDDLDIRKDVAVHSIDGHIRQPIVNYNQKQIALLTKEDLTEINRHLDAVPDVMKHFDYEYIRP